ncbi:MAG: 16S rRNA (cytidine(1402)-2'-O)-methyltransferase [Candidatus Omnitrophica bacterium]|nr:16S rRNA (cytidine(1402)-2'-O)-methyltransferase [Candidatus Omnitrophota bacterium]
MLYIAATPIGNLEDITLRAIRILGEVDLVLAEDTRKTGFLLKHLGIKKDLISFYEHNELKKIPQIIEQLKQGKNIALVSSAGTPTISDPGYKLIKACRREHLPVTSLPGPSSIINCLALTSLPHDKFAFLGYLPRKPSARRKLFNKVKEWEITLVFFESPYRILSSLKVIAEILGNRRITIGREMTKKFEEALELEVEEAINHFNQKAPRGEFVLIIGPGL